MMKNCFKLGLTVLNQKEKNTMNSLNRSNISSIQIDSQIGLDKKTYPKNTNISEQLQDLILI